jgi:hypothetical protein
VAAERISVGCLLDPAAPVSAVAEEAVPGAAAPVIGAAVTTVAVIGVAVIGVAAIGVAAIGMVVTGTAVIGVITSSLSATSGFPTGGAGAGAAIRMDTTVAVIPTITMAPAMTAMATAATEMTVTEITVGTAIAADPGSLNCSGDSVALAIIVALSTGFWGPKRGEQFEITSAIMEM